MFKVKAKNLNLSILIFSVRITGVLLDCAPQKNEYHDFKNGKWSPKMEILEPYEEGCSEVDDKGERTTPTKYVIQDNYLSQIIHKSLNKQNIRGT